MARRIRSNLIALSFVICFVGCGSETSQPSPSPEPLPSPPPPSPPPAPRPLETVVPEAWISQSKMQWPQIVLTNDAQFDGHTPLRGASGFLIRRDNGQVVAATVAHLIGAAGGVEPAIPIDQLSGKIRSWRMFPRTMSDRAVEITSVGVEGLDRGNLDWLILSIKKSDELPAYPLKVRRQPVAVGETVYLIGCPYAERDCKQNVYICRVTERRFRDRFRYDLSSPVDLRGFSGAPIVDRNGHLVGAMTIWFDPKMSGNKHTEGGGEDVASIVSFLQSSP